MKSKSIIGEIIKGCEVIGRSKRMTKNKKAYYYVFKCHCGNTFETIPSVFRNGKQRGCGCLLRNCDVAKKEITDKQIEKYGTIPYILMNKGRSNTGIKGVSQVPTGFKASIQYNGKRTHKTFTTFEEAKAWRKYMEKQLHEPIIEQYKKDTM